jgi:exosortase
MPPWPTVALIGMLGLAFFAVFHFAIMQQARMSWGNADWQHAYFVPLISLYMAWQWRAKIMSLRPTLFWPGLIPLVVSVPAYVLFQIGPLSNHMAQGFSVVLGLFGLMLFLLGPRMIQPLFLPIAFLVFAITISEMIMINVTFRLQGIAAQGGHVVLNLIGITTDIKGHTLEVTHPQTGQPIPLNIAEACSGMRMLIAFLALGVAVALVGLKHWWQRIALIAAGVPVALVMNIIRVVVLGLLSLENPEWARGQAHMFIGFVLLVGAFLVFLGIAWVLQKVVNEDDASVQAELLKQQKAERAAQRSGKSAAKVAVKAPAARLIDWPATTWAMLRTRGVVVSMVFLLICGASVTSVIAGMGVRLRKLPIQALNDRQVREVPTETESWVQVGQDQIMSEEMLEELGTRNYLSRVYQRRPGKGTPMTLELHMTYYTGMIDTVPHVADRCMTGAGFLMVEDSQDLPIVLDRTNWVEDTGASAIAGATIYAAPPSKFGDSLPSRKVRLPRGIENLKARFTSFQPPRGGMVHVAYFFMANGGLTPSANDVRVLAFDLRANYAYYLKVQVSSAMVGSKAALSEEAASLLSELMPEIARTAPDWIDVQKGEYPADNPARKGATAKASR